MKALFLLLFSGLKWGKLAASGGSMLLSLVVYATVWGWRYAAGFIALLFAHEMGHILGLGHRGLDVGAPAFIPFVGAWIALKDQPVDVETEAYVAIADLWSERSPRSRVSMGESEDSGLPLAIAYSGRSSICSICSRSRRLTAAGCGCAEPADLVPWRTHPAGVDVVSPEPDAHRRRDPRRPATHEGVALRSQGA
jgi:hypothetical protein